jgi:type I restriction enzyme, S subunit
MREGWQSKTLGEIADVKGGKRVPKGCHLQSEATDHPYITVSDFTDDGTIDVSHLRYVSNEVFDQIDRYTISSKDLYLSIAGTIGKTGYIPVELDGANLTENACKLVLHPGTSRDFLYYFTKTDDFAKQAGANTRTAAQPKLALERLKTIKLDVPPLPEQQRIVAILDEAFAGLATATANTEKNLKNVSELFESYLNSIFGQNWEMQALGDISENLDSKRIPVTKSDRKSGDIPYYGASGPVDCVDNFIFDEDLLLVSEDGANLVMRTYPIAFSIAGKSWVNNHAHVLRFPDLASQKFVEYYLNSISLMPYVNGMAQPKLNQKALNSIPVPWPKLEERENVVARLEELAAQTDRLRELYEMRISALAELKQSTLGKAFSGALTSPPSQAIKEAAE